MSLPKSIYDKLSESEKAQFIKQRYEKQQPYEINDSLSPYATSRDINLRELEIKFILENLPRNAHEILDLGCGNGYTDYRIAQKRNANILGIDFSGNLINAAQKLDRKFPNLKGNISFVQKDILTLDASLGSFDTIITERTLLNLPNRKTQIQTIHLIHTLLKLTGTFIMIEGSLDGLYAMNQIRKRFNLPAIPNRDKDNVQSLKFIEGTLEKTLKPLFAIVKKQHFGMYYFISRVLHPLLVEPEQPRFDARINEVARRIAEKMPEHETQGHMVAYVLRRI